MNHPSLSDIKTQFHILRNMAMPSPSLLPGVSTKGFSPPPTLSLVPLLNEMSNKNPSECLGNGESSPWGQRGCKFRSCCGLLWPGPAWLCGVDGCEVTECSPLQPPPPLVPLPSSPPPSSPTMPRRLPSSSARDHYEISADGRETKGVRG